MRWSFEHFNSQFEETSFERQQRWFATKAKRKAEGKCWQCAKPIVQCDCPNITHGESQIKGG